VFCFVLKESGITLILTVRLQIVMQDQKVLNFENATLPYRKHLVFYTHYPCILLGAKWFKKQNSSPLKKRIFVELGQRQRRETVRDETPVDPDQ